MHQLKSTFIQYLFFFFGINFKEITPFKERVVYLKTSISIALPFTLVFSLVNYLTGFYYLAAIEALTAILFLLPALFIGNNEKKIALAEYLVLIYGMFVTKALVVFGGIVGTGTLWIFAFPFIAFLLKGQKIGWYMCILWMFVMSLGLSYDNEIKLYYPYPEGFKPQLVMAMLFYSLIAAAFNLARSRFEVLLVEQINRVEQESKFKSEFLANVSHEIRTPMNAIYNLVDFAIDSKDEKQKHQHLEKLKTSTKRLLDLLNNILDFAKLEKHQETLDLSSMNLRQEFNNIQNMLSASSTAKHLRLNFQIDESIPEIVIADPIKTHQVLFNIISNAVKFTPENGRIDINCTISDQSYRSIKLLFSIKDNGIGMNDEQQRIIFESFKQADSSTSRQYGGTGLGLSIAKQLVSLMNGNIWVESQLNQGSNFFVELPFNKVTDNISKADIANLNTASEEPQTYPRLKGLNILLVEDDEINQYVATEMLQQEGLNVDVAHDGQDAVNVLKENHNFDAILMDINMPNMNGFEATENIRRMIPYRHKPIIGLSANILPKDLQKGIEAGMNITLAKPIVKHDLMQNLEKFIFGDTSPIDPEKSNNLSNSVTSPLFQIEGLDLSNSYLSKHPEILGNILFLFAEKYQNFEMESHQAFAEGDFEKLRIMAHTLKGNLSNLGLNKLSELALKLENSCSEDHESCEIIFQRISPKIKELVLQIQAAKAKKDIT